MKHTSLLLAGALCAAFAVAGLAACGAFKRCDPQSCTGCCDSNDVCQAGNVALACGVGGGACNTCAPSEFCQGGFCTPLSGSNGGSHNNGGDEDGGEDPGGDAGVTDGGMTDGGNPDAGNPDGGPGDGGSCTPVAESCNGVDDDCDGKKDEDFDQDEDGVTTCAGDCDDGRPGVHPDAPEVANGLDDDCNGLIDDKIVGADVDGDGTAYPEDCDDTNTLIGPNAIELTNNGADDDCDGQIDETVPPCDGATLGTTANDFAKAMGLCEGVSSATLAHGISTAQSIRTAFGTQFVPQQGAKMLLLSTGIATDRITTSTYLPENGTNFGTTYAPPLPNVKLSCVNGNIDARDLTEIDFVLKAPQNVQAFSFDFAFFSADTPDYLCNTPEYLDRFLVSSTSQALGGTETNIAFDSIGNPVSAASDGFSICQTSGIKTCSQGTALLVGTGYETLDSSGVAMGGSTGWVTNTSPVIPGETFTLRLYLHDSGDGTFDSQVLIDNFRWIP